MIPTAAVLARALSALAIAALIAVPAALVPYEHAREAWRARGAAIDRADYDAAASDAAYLEVEHALVWVTRAVRVATALVLAAALAIGRALPRHARMAGTRARRIGARALDLATLALALALTRVEAESPGVRECLDWIAPALLFALALAAAANGATLGDRVAGLARSA